MRRFTEFVFADGTTLISLYPITRKTARKLHLSDARLVKAR